MTGVLIRHKCTKGRWALIEGVHLPFYSLTLVPIFVQKIGSSFNAMFAILPDNTFGVFYKRYTQIKCIKPNSVIRDLFHSIF